MMTHPHWQCTSRCRTHCRPYTACSSRWIHCVAAGGDGSACWRRFACGFVGGGPHGRDYNGGKISTRCLVSNLVFSGPVW